MDFSTLFGTINNIVLDILDETGTYVIDRVVIYDIEYIVRAVTIIVSLIFVYKMFLTLIRGLMKNVSDRY